MRRDESTVDRLKRELQSVTDALEFTKKMLWVEQEASRKLMERYKRDHEEGNNLRLRLAEANRDLVAKNSALRRKLSKISTLVGKLAAETRTEE
jgi:hypothetical protein